MEADVLPMRRDPAIFITDVRLGILCTQAATLLDFLRETESKRFHLVGDMIDSWSLRQKL
jgi:UDP-2,3-diacylglucosamine pyrophosphatase LpxH